MVKRNPVLQSFDHDDYLRALKRSGLSNQQVEATRQALTPCRKTPSAPGTPLWASGKSSKPR